MKLGEAGAWEGGGRLPNNTLAMCKRFAFWTLVVSAGRLGRLNGRSGVEAEWVGGVL